MNITDINRSTTALSLVVALALAVKPSTADAASKCYDLDGPDVGQIYQVGDSVDTRHAVINILEFRPDGVPSGHPSPQAEIVDSDLPEAGAPSLRITSTVVQVRPKTPARTITLNFAENTGANDRQRQMFAVNGDVRNDLVGGFAQLDGEVMGRAKFGGTAKVTVTAEADDPAALPTWVRGTLTLTALDNGISGFFLGANSQLFIDHVCMEN